MTTTPDEKKALLTEAWKLVGSAMRSVRLSDEDYSDLRALCIEAADKAIDSWEPDRGRSLPSWIYRHIVQAKRDYLRGMTMATTHNRQSTFERDASCFSELSDGMADRGECPVGCVPHSRESAHHRSMIQDMEIIIDRARNDGVLTEREYMVLVARRQNVKQRTIAVEIGVSFQRVGQIEAEAVEKIRKQYKTAE